METVGWDPEVEARDPQQRLRRIKGLADVAPLVIDADDLAFLERHDASTASIVRGLQRDAGHSSTAPRQAPSQKSAAEMEDLADGLCDALDDLVFQGPWDGDVQAVIEQKTEAFYRAVETAPITSRTAVMMVAPLLRALHSRIRKTEARLAGIEAQPKGLDYHGTWQRAIRYSRNQATTHDGSLWAALKETRGDQPGTAPECWQLVAKRGERGKDGKDYA